MNQEHLEGKLAKLGKLTKVTGKSNLDEIPETITIEEKTFTLRGVVFFCDYKENLKDTRNEMHYFTFFTVKSECWNLYDGLKSRIVSFKCGEKIQEQQISLVIYMG